MLGVLAGQSVKADGPFTNASLQGKYAYANNTSGSDLTLGARV